MNFDISTYCRTQSNTDLFFSFSFSFLLYSLHLGTCFYFFWYPPSHVQHPCHPSHGFCQEGHKWHSYKVILGSGKIVNKTTTTTGTFWYFLVFYGVSGTFWSFLEQRSTNWVWPAKCTCSSFLVFDFSLEIRIQIF